MLTSLVPLVLICEHKNLRASYSWWPFLKWSLPGNYHLQLLRILGRSFRTVLKYTHSLPNGRHIAQCFYHSSVWLRHWVLSLEPKATCHFLALFLAPIWFSCPAAIIQMFAPQKTVLHHFSYIYWWEWEPKGDLSFSPFLFFFRGSG